MLIFEAVFYCKDSFTIKGGNYSVKGFHISGVKQGCINKIIKILDNVLTEGYDFYVSQGVRYLKYSL